MFTTGSGAEYELETSVRLFPEPGDVFAESVDRHAAYLKTLCSIDLELVSDELTGWVHVVVPIEPLGGGGAVGEYTTDAHNEHVSVNWISFKVDDDGKYKFQGDFGYFFLADPGRPEPLEDFRSELEQHVEYSNEVYEELKLEYQKSGWPEVDPTDPDESPLERLGGRCEGGNWETEDPPSGFRLSEADEGLRIETSDGRELLFVASLPAYFAGFSADSVLLFFDPVERIALLTFEYG